MKKLFYFLLGFLIISCTQSAEISRNYVSDDVSSDTTLSISSTISSETSSTTPSELSSSISSSSSSNSVESSSSESSESSSSIKICEVVFKFYNGDEDIIIYVQENDPLGYLPPNPNKEHYTFQNWNSEVDGSGTSYTTFHGIYDDTVIHAYYTAKVYQVNMRYRDGYYTIDLPYTVTIEDLPLLIPEPVILPAYTDTKAVKSWYNEFAHIDYGYYYTEEFEVTHLTEDMIINNQIVLIPRMVHPSLKDIEYMEMTYIPESEYYRIERGCYEHQYQYLTNKINDMAVSKYNVTYELFYTVREWAFNNGYDYMIGGAGNVGYCTLDPIDDENRYQPVSVDWKSIIFFMNAFSEMNGIQYPYHPYVDKYGETLKTISQMQTSEIIGWGYGGYTMLTEGEWYYIASNKGQTPYNYIAGDNQPFNTTTNPDIYSWHRYNSDDQTHPVGLKLPNELGIYDLIGNTFEWVWDIQMPLSTVLPDYLRENYMGNVIEGRICNFDDVHAYKGSPYNLTNCPIGYYKTTQSIAYISFRIVYRKTRPVPSPYFSEG